MQIKWLSLYMLNRALTIYDSCGDTDFGTFVPETDCLKEGSRLVGGFLAKRGFNIDTLVADDEVDGVYASTTAMIAAQSGQATGDKFLVGALVYTLGAEKTAALGDYTSVAAANSIAVGINQGNLKVLKGLTGNWTAGTSNKKPGMGFQREKHSSTTFAIPIKHYSVDANLEFWDSVNNRKDWSMLFVFEDFAVWGAIDDTKEVIPMDIVMQPVSEEELGGQRRFEGTAGWTAQHLPYSLLSPVVAAFTKAKMSELFS